LHKSARARQSTPEDLLGGDADLDISRAFPKDWRSRPAAKSVISSTMSPLEVQAAASPWRRLYDGFVRVYLTADLRSLAASRIVLATVLLSDLFRRWAQLGLWYTNEGIIPNHTLLWRPSWDHVFSFFYMASYAHEAVLGFIVCALVFTALLLGLRTKVAQVASLVCMLSLHGRTLLFDNGGDVALGLLCTWTTFLPTGRRWSIDALLARNRPSLSTTQPWEPFAAEEGKFASLAIMAVTCQLALIYTFNFVHKQGSSWREGSAVYYVLHLDRLATWFAVWLRGWIPVGAVRALTWGTMAIEAALPVLLLSPVSVKWCRRLAIVLVLMLHGGFALCMNLGNFVPAMMAYTPILLRREDWDAIERWWLRGARRAARGERLAKHVSALVTRAAAALTPGTFARVMEAGPTRAALRRRLPLARELTVAFYIFIAANQVLDENGAAHTIIDHHNSPAVAAAVSYLDLFQGWSMFAPDAPMTDFNIVVDAVTAEGRHVDPWNEVANPRYPNPGVGFPPAMGTTWLFYGYENHLPSRPAYHQALREWILRYPDRTGHAGDRLVSFRVLKVEDDSPRLGERAPRNLRSEVLFSFPP
jgi:hypothetical protein